MSDVANHRVWFVLWIFALLLLIPSPGSAQEDEIRAAVEEQMKDARKMVERMRRAKRGSDDEGSKSEDEEGDDDEESEDEENSDEESEDEEKEPEVVMRPTEPPQPPDPKEFELRPDENGRIQFRFRNQPWPAFLEWLAEVSGYTLDWSEMPVGYLNLVTHRSYPTSEARDIVNRMLLSRGYTMLLDGRIMTVVKLDKLDPSTLRRVEDESELLDLPPHDFVKITFQLPDKLKAETMAEDVKLFLSPNGKVQPLVSTNRLLVIDAVVNLREVSRLVNSEHAATKSHVVPREFHIRFVRADYVADQVMILLGLDPSTRRSPQELQVEQQRLQLFQQMQQRGKDVSKFLRNDKAPTVYIAVNKRLNSLLVNAPPQEMSQIERAIEQLDVSSGPAGGSILSTVTSGFGKGTEMKRYQLVTLKPESVVNALQDIGNLNPRTMLQMDSDAKVIFANATPEDHEKIAAIIDKLDGSGRSVEVIWLRKLPADQVAVTIMNLLAPKEEEKKDNSYSYYYMRRYGSSNENEDKPHSEFRCEPDIEHNRLILFANEAEMEEVNRLLVKLGELPGDQGNPNTVRVQDARSLRGTAEMIQKIRELWPSLSDTPIEFQGELPKAPEPEQAEPKADDNPTEPETPKNDNPEADEEVEKTVRHGPPSPPAHLTRRAVFPVSQPPESAAESRASVDPEPAPKNNTAEDSPLEDVAGDPTKTPIRISIAEDGRLIISSKDTTALDALEDLIARVSPPPKSHRVFYLKYALASLVKINLEEYFEGEENFDTQENWMRAYWGLNFQKSNQSDNKGLASRRPIRFIYDIDTNSILVRDATPSQMAVIEELIEIYDQAPSEDSISARRLAVYKLKYSQAETVAATIKEVFRDLLSSRDKEFANNNNDKEKRSASSSVFRIFGGGGDNEDDKAKSTKVKASFEGALSIGVDHLSNAVIVSAQEEWLPSIEEIIEYMDENAKPDTTVSVSSVAVPMDPVLIEKLSSLMRPWPGNKKPDDNVGKGKPKDNGNNKNPQNNAAAERQSAVREED